MKRPFDLLVAVTLIFFLWPFLLLFSLIIFLTDFANPVFISMRVGKNEQLFRFLKFRSMRPEKTDAIINSTSSNDPRITKVGHLIRKYKIDELPQLFNVLVGQMSLVGPRPNVLEETRYYNNDERKIFSVLPGITDFASVVFSNEGEILRGSSNPDKDYREKIWPLKSQLSLFYVENKTVALDLRLCIITFVGIFSRKAALAMVINTLENSDASDGLVESVSVILSHEYQRQRAMED